MLTQLTAHSSRVLISPDSSLHLNCPYRPTSVTEPTLVFLSPVKPKLQRRTPLMRRIAQGFTLLELMVVIALLAIFVSIAIPSFSNLIANSRTETAASELHGMLMSARSDAVTKRTSITLKKIANDNWQSVQGTTTTGTLTFPSSVTMTSVPPGLIELKFMPNGSAGGLSNPVTLKLQSENANKTYEIAVQPSGSIRLSSSNSSAITP